MAPLPRGRASSAVLCLLMLPISAVSLQPGRGLGEEEPVPSKLPSTFEFISPNYTGHRFEGRGAAVFGGTSGIGFATAAMLLQECVAELVVSGRNAKQGRLAAVLLGRISQSHCSYGHEPKVRYMRADVGKRQAVRAVLQSFKKLHVVLNTAGVGGWTGNLEDLPDEVLLSRHDAIFNNLYGVVTVTSEALRLWKTAHGYTPSMVHLSSEQGMTPCPGCGLYGASKHGIIGVVTSAANLPNATVRVNTVLPGLVDTPLTWNQVRQAKFVNGTLNRSFYPQLQTAWQCVVGGMLIEDGECQGGGTGYGCPCPDVRREDKRNPLVFKAPGLWPPIDPRRIGSAILRLLDPKSKETGKSVVVDNGKKEWECAESMQDPLYNFCPQLKPEDAAISAENFVASMV